MGDQHSLHRQGSDGSNGGQQLLTPGPAGSGIDHHHARIADQKAQIAHSPLIVTVGQAVGARQHVHAVGNLLCPQVMVLRQTRCRRQQQGEQAQPRNGAKRQRAQ